MSGFSEGEVLGLVAFILFWLFGMELLSQVEHMKKANDLVTYRDIVAFSKGEQPVRDDTAFSRRHPLARALIMFTITAILGGVLGFVVAHFI